jgi:hypothetical protein
MEYKHLNNDTFEEVFASPKGVALANKLTEYLFKNENINNWDECLIAIANSLAKKIDTQIGCPVSQFFLVELKSGISNTISGKRFHVELNQN